MTYTEWKAEGKRRFGVDPLAWKFICPSCGHVASVADWKNAGAPEGAVAFSCIGRYTLNNKHAANNSFRKKGGPCNYTGGGLFRLNPIEVDFEDGSEPMHAFAFADVPHVEVDK